MKILVCGSRSWHNVAKVRLALARFFKPCCEDCNENVADVTVIDGGAHGADELGHMVAVENGFLTKRFPADWNRYGKRAGYIRNQQMLTEGHPDLVLAFWDGRSRGTRHMIELARKAGVAVEIIRP